MKTTQNIVTSLFSKARKAPDEQRYFSQDEIRSILENSANQQPVIKRGVQPMIVMSAIMGLAIAAGSYLLSPTGSDHTETSRPAPVRTAQQPTHDSDQSTTVQPRAGVEQAPVKPTTEETKSNNEQAAAELDLKGIRQIQLSDDELKMLGVYRNGNGITTYMRADHDLFSETYSTLGAEFKSVPFDSTIVTGAHCLRMITDDHGARRMYTREDDDNDKTSTNTTSNSDLTMFLVNQENIWDSKMATMIDSANGRYLSPSPTTPEEVSRYLESEKMDREFEKNLNTYLRVNRWIAISVPSDLPYTVQDSIDKKWRPSLVLWFEPKPELVAVLPERIRRELQLEIQLADKADMHKETNEKGVPGPGERYLGVWNTAAGAITQSTLLPNPIQANGELALRYTLNDRRDVRITLRDLFGKPVMELASSKGKHAGEWAETFHLNNVAAGMYLLTIETDKGEHITQRLIVE